MMWEEIKPITSPTHNNALVADVQRHLTKREFEYYGGFSDPVTQVHECTHGINAKLRNRTPGVRDNCFYVFGNRYVAFPEPPMRKRDIIPFVPREYTQHRLFKMYISGQQAWDDTPLYVFDEWVAYTNGAMVQQSKSEIEYALVFAFYAFALLDAARQRDYEFLTDLSLFVIWNIHRLEPISIDHQHLINQLQERVRHVRVNI